MNHNLNTITESIIGCAYTLANTLGHRFIEKIYEDALNHELSKNGLRAKQFLFICHRWIQMHTARPAAGTKKKTINYGRHGIHGAASGRNQKTWNYEIRERPRKGPRRGEMFLRGQSAFKVLSIKGLR